MECPIIPGGRDSDEGAGDAQPSAAAAAGALPPSAATAALTDTGRRKRQRARTTYADAAPPHIHLLPEDGPAFDVDEAAAAAVAGREQHPQLHAAAETVGDDRGSSGEEGLQGRRGRRRSRRDGGEQRGRLVQQQEQSATEEVRVSRAVVDN